MTITLPWPPASLGPNAKRRKHWSAYREPTRCYRNICAVITLASRLSVCGGDAPIGMTITFCPPDRRRRDDDGMIGAFKAGRDGMADGWRVDDRRFRPVYAVGDPVAKGAVIVALDPDSLAGSAADNTPREHPALSERMRGMLAMVEAARRPGLTGHPRERSLVALEQRGLVTGRVDPIDEDRCLWTLSEAGHDWLLVEQAARL